MIKIATKIILTIVLIGVFHRANANPLSEILHHIRDMHRFAGLSLTVEQQQLYQQQDIDHMLHELNRNVTGNSGWGSYRVHDYQSYGSNADSWAKVMSMAESGQGSGDVGGIIQTLAHQFPIDNATYGRGVSDPTNQLYYQQQAQTVLAARATSQLDYDRIQAQIAYQQMLQNQIEQTKDLKAAVDLSSRIQVEGNLIQLSILRQAALANQQQALNNQATLISSLANARFLSQP